MKKILALLLSVSAIFCISAPVFATDAQPINEPRTAYLDCDISELNESISPMATSSITEVVPGKVEGRLFNGAVGLVDGRSTTFNVSGLPSSAKITNVQAWNPSKTNISQGKFTALNNIQVYRNNIGSGYFKFWVTSEPTSSTSSSTTAFNGEDPNGTYYIKIQAKVIQNYTGMDGFTVRGTKVRITYTY